VSSPREPDVGSTSVCATVLNTTQVARCVSVLAARTEQSCPTTRHEGAWGKRRYSSYSFSTSALDGCEWSASRPGLALPLGKGPPVPTVQEAR
jgi:hypothetical protein